MQFYWRIIEELRFLGETVIFHDPTLLRQFRWWLKKNAGAVAMCDTDYSTRNNTLTMLGIPPSMN